MRIISFDEITRLNISPKQCVDWVEKSFLTKYESNLPPKISIKLPENVFFNTMPSYLPYINRFGVKVVSRYPERIPSLLSDILLYESDKGDLLALMDGTWITTMRTGAVAALTIKTLKSSAASQYSFLGLGNTARATLLCLLAIYPDEPLNIKLLAYKGQELDFINRFKNYSNISFKVCNSYEESIIDSDVIISAITSTDDLIARDSCYKEGVLVVPIHTRGFQNCDLFFDKVFADDKGHVEGFKYFNQFKSFDELSNVLLKSNVGRESVKERILAYNIGISLHDVYFASQIYNLLVKETDEKELFVQKDKFWI